MTTTKVDFASLDQMVQDIKNLHGRMSRDYQDLCRQLNGTLEQWGESTASRQAYTTFKTSCDKEFSEMSGDLEKIAPALDAANLEHQGAEARNEKRFGKFGDGAL